MVRQLLKKYGCLPRDKKKRPCCVEINRLQSKDWIVRCLIIKKKIVQKHAEFKDMLVPTAKNLW
jgi:hypothetical protein